ncbi:MAG: glycosyltransferase family 4 protein [Nanoarchaeota archaeon]|nr:glycosyltransferase family 4 protein [Nanoarchaeota archaeon]
MVKQIRKLKILVCGQEYPPNCSGIGNLMYNKVENFKAMGHDVKVCSPNGPDIKFEGSFEKIKKFGGLGVAYFWFETSNYLKKNSENYDRIYLHNPMVFRKLDTESSKKIRCVVHTLFYHSFKSYGYKKLVQIPYYLIMIFIQRFAYLFMRKYKFIVTSPDTSRELNFYGINEERNGFDGKFPIVLNGFNFSKKQNVSVLKEYDFIDLKKKNLLFVGRFHPQKNLFKLLDTFKELDEKAKGEFRLIMVGDGEEMEKLKEHVKEGNISNVEFLGALTREKLDVVYDLCDYIILSSSYEGNPLALSEALGHGLVPILSPINVFKFMKEKIGSGLIVDFENSYNASNMIIDYDKNLDLKKEKVKIKKLAAETFSWDKVTMEYLKY